ncbi:hypothetical protein E2C01_041207 [Portunus trituberculatus]|uniref:Uncharacterized protein n=1 Tax=Portunus trituberculatus TaxID=210409 RepID=A0A5B7FIM1_PORTR|nr:hypothetical protein [Portunus trituberculatus]
METHRSANKQTKIPPPSCNRQFSIKCQLALPPALKAARCESLASVLPSWTRLAWRSDDRVNISACTEEADECP